MVINILCNVITDVVDVNIKMCPLTSDVGPNQSLLANIPKLSGNNFTYQQDGAPAQRSRQTVTFLHLHVPEFVEPKNWPLNSPDLKPVDYSIWGAL